MSFWGVTIEEIDTVENIIGADRIQKATLKGIDFQFVIAKNIRQPGDKVLYFPIDSILPENIISFLGLIGKLAGPGKNRIKTIKLKNVISQGVMGDLSMIANKPAEVGITEYLGVTKYEPEEVLSKGGNIRNHPDGIERYDIEGCQRNREVVDMFMDRTVVISEKVEGCLEYNTKVHTREFGILSIGEIVEKNIECHVRSFDTTTSTETWEKVIKWWSKEDNGDWYIIETDDGNTLTVTGNHYIWMPEISCWRMVKDIVIGDTLLIH